MFTTVMLVLLATKILSVKEIKMKDIFKNKLNWKSQYKFIFEYICLGRS